MKKRLIVLTGCGLMSAAAMAADPYETWLTIQQQRGTEIELIRVANDKPLLAIEETDAEVAGILEELDAIEEESNDSEAAKDSQ